VGNCVDDGEAKACAGVAGMAAVEGLERVTERLAFKSVTGVLHNHDNGVACRSRGGDRDHAAGRGVSQRVFDEIVERLPDSSSVKVCDEILGVPLHAHTTGQRAGREALAALFDQLG
jgi:hypothetical protein